VQRGTHTECGVLGTAQLPAELAALHFDYSKGDYATRYVLMDTDDCGDSKTVRRHLLALDPETESIVWYLDVAARSTIGGTNLNGWRFQPGATDRFMGRVDKRYLYEWAWDGSVIAAKDLGADGECDGTSQGPCIHHDAYRSDFSGKTFVIASAQSSLDGTGTAWDMCDSDSRFLDDGFQIWDADFVSSVTKSLMVDYGYDPTQDGGPNAETDADADSCDASIWQGAFDPYATIDWTHLNSLTASSFGGAELLDLSLKGWDQVLRVDEWGALLWRLSASPEYSDWQLAIGHGIEGDATFAGQHDVHAVAQDSLMMLDNLGSDETSSRVLRLALDEQTGVATIDRSWAIADTSGTPLLCRLEGSAQEVPGTEGESVLSMCNDAFSVVELADSTGAAVAPELMITLPEDGFCTEGGPQGRFGIHGWYRAFPVEAIGEF
jgi:hypothetical protein